MKINLVFSILFFFACSLKMGAQTVKVSSFNQNQNPTKAIMDAFRAESDTLIIDKQDQDWIVEPISLVGIKNKVVIIEPEVQIMAKANAFSNKSDVLFEFVDCENIRIIGNGAKLCMNKKEYVDGEWRHGISIRGSKDISIENLSIQDSGGDGVYLAGSKRNSFSENIVLRSIESINNKRQGISIISAKNVQVQDSRFAKTIGTNPAAGIDIEPNRPEDTIENIFVSNCIFEDNFGSGIVISLGQLDSSSTPVSIQFDNCTTRNNHSVDNPKVSAEIIVTANADKPVKGALAFSNCTISNSKWGMLYSRKLAEAYSVSFIDCQVRNINSHGEYPVVYLEVPNYYENKGPLGGFTFKNLHLEDINGTNFMKIRGSKIGTLREVKDISANVVSKTKFRDPVEYINYFSFMNNKVNLDFKTE